jgi:hypothetical protein
MKSNMSQRYRLFRRGWGVYYFEDIKVTRDLIRAGQILKIDVLDHIILGKRTEERPPDFVSLREMGYFYGSMAEFVGQNGALKGQAGESVTRGERRRRELEGSKAVAAARLPAP